jgi:hypothetical protein
MPRWLSLTSMAAECTLYGWQSYSIGGPAMFALLHLRCLSSFAPCALGPSQGLLRAVSVSSMLEAQKAIQSKQQCGKQIIGSRHIITVPRLLITQGPLVLSQSVAPTQTAPDQCILNVSMPAGSRRAAIRDTTSSTICA